MWKKTIKIAWPVLVLLLLGAGYVYYLLLYPVFGIAQAEYVFVDRDDTIDSLVNKLSVKGQTRQTAGFRILAQLKGVETDIPTGRYALGPDDNIWTVFRRIYRQHQTPVRLTLTPVRTLEQVAVRIAEDLMVDSAEIMTVLNDSVFYTSLGCRKETRMCLFVPNTYEVYWNVSARGLLERMAKERDTFWKHGRMEKAEAIGLTPDEVYTLASIVDEETNRNGEKPVVAGLYMNRLHRGMPLQADPTVKFALGDFMARRITKRMLEVESPYNTYRNTGLPPGPIRMASIRGIDSVLGYTKHSYIYMCAREDFSGYHNFASNHNEHIKNAKKYWRALNQRKIFN